MAKKSVSREFNRKNLVFFSEVLEQVEHFAFFGTLLGLERDGDLIEGDDDIDFYVPMRERENLISKLADYGLSVKCDEAPNDTPYFLQARREIAGIEVLADFYLFEEIANEFLVDRWNFSGNVSYLDMSLHIPKKLIYPLQKREFFGQQVSLPNRTRELCEFLYGSTWKQKLQKGTCYKTLIWRNKPVVFVGKFSYAIYKSMKILKKCKRLIVNSVGAQLAPEKRR